MRVLSCFLIFASFGLASSEVVNRANALYLHTQYENSLRLLGQDVAPDIGTFLLTGKNYFMLGDYKKAIDSFEKAVAQSPQSSEAALWLGRAWGRRAESSNPLSAFGYASKTRQWFEKAVALDPKNSEAKNDLFDFYVNAPGIVGGGLEKAEAVAKRIEQERPPEYEFEEAQIAEKRGDLKAAEAHLRRAMELAPGEAGRVVDVARFVAKHGSLEESDRLFAQARKMAPGKPSVAFAEAKTDVEHHRNAEQARKLLEAYVQDNLTPDDPSRQDAQKLLKSLR